MPGTCGASKYGDGGDQRVSTKCCTWISENESFADMVYNRTAGRKKKQLSSTDSGNSDDSTPAAKKPKLEDLEGQTLRRGQMIFRDWSKQRCFDCITHMDPSVNCNSLANCKVDGLKQILEHILGIRVFGGKPDRCGTDNVVRLFASLQKCYVREGRLLDNVELDCETQMPCWEGNPALQITKQDGRDVVLEYKREGAAVRTASLVPEPEDQGSWHLDNIFSMFQAVIVSATHSYAAGSFFFPEKAKRLQRTFSDEVGATGVVSSEAHDEMLKEKKQPKAKATSGRVSLGTPSKKAPEATGAAASPNNAEGPQSSDGPTWVWHEGKLCKAEQKDGVVILVPNTGLTIRERFRPNEGDLTYDAENYIWAPNYPAPHLAAAILGKRDGRESAQEGAPTSAASGSGGVAQAVAVAEAAAVTAADEGDKPPVQDAEEVEEKAEAKTEAGNK